MLGEGETAPTVALPGVVEGDRRTVDLGDAVGENVVVLAFYPGDFNPACDGESCDLTELDLLGLQRDVDVYAVSTDSVFTHRVFAAEYSLSLCLLSDTRGEAAAAYDVVRDGEQLLAERAVFVLNQEGIVRYAWATGDLRERPDVDAVRAAIADVGGDSTGLGRYRIGYDRYEEGRQAFRTAIDRYEDRDWLLAGGDFERAMAAFREAADQFDSAARFAESAPLERGFGRAQRKATALWQAAEWLAASADEYASGNGAEADAYRQDAETPLATARDVAEPPDPADIDLDAETPPDGDGARGFRAPADPTATAESTSAGGDTADSDGDDVDAAVEAVEAGTDEEVSDGAGRSADDDDPGADDAADEPDLDLDLTDPTE